MTRFALRFESGLSLPLRIPNSQPPRTLLPSLIGPCATPAIYCRCSAQGAAGSRPVAQSIEGSCSRYLRFSRGHTPCKCVSVFVDPGSNAPVNKGLCYSLTFSHQPSLLTLTSTPQWLPRMKTAHHAWIRATKTQIRIRMAPSRTP